MGGACSTLGGDGYAYKVVDGKPKGLGKLDINGKVILKWILEKYVGSLWL
jgi:hypothetical protein